MATIAARHYYRTVYLKSEHWADLRLRRIVHQRGRCTICSFESHALDVHHIAYRKLWDVRLEDLRALCRTCHEKVHKLLDDNFEVDATTAKVRWGRISRKFRRLANQGFWTARMRLGFTRPQRDKRIRKEFLQARYHARKYGYICTTRQMQWRNSLFKAYRASTEPITMLWWLNATAGWSDPPWPCGEH